MFAEKNSPTQTKWGAKDMIMLHSIQAGIQSVIEKVLASAFTEGITQR